MKFLPSAALLSLTIASLRPARAAPLPVPGSTAYSVPDPRGLRMDG